MKKTLIERIEVGSGGAASIEFTSIPQTYADLLLVISGRADSAFSSPDDMANDLLFRFNSDAGTNYSSRRLAGNGSTANSTAFNTAPSIDELNRAYTNGSGATANTFASTQLYIPNYTSSSAKSISIESVNEHNATTAYMNLLAGLWDGAALNTIEVYHLISGNFVQYSSASLYGVTAGNDGTTTVS